MLNSLFSNWPLAAAFALILMSVAAGIGLWLGKRRKPLVITVYVPPERPPVDNLVIETFLPRIAQELAHVEFIPVENQPGPGGDLFSKGINLMKQGKYLNAGKFFERSLKLGLTATYVCGALAFLGRIALERGDLQEAVELFLKCLSSPCLTAEAAFSAAGYLQRIYECAGMKPEAEIAGNISTRANVGKLSLNRRVLADIESYWQRERQRHHPSLFSRGLRWILGETSR
ncbi:MAG TPA: tetratricopeptide repeat protein [Accumulibacter sp.]|nr:tetratricopeptide repeat protein [Accumulibacter sp.]HMW19108.1 tetratricopeptide repeat protein [Accumulibacter sp.]HMX23835.1 tetratricopeptide repeat protein [Accumulibacter sp.]HNC19100.1 tetratricopeptide repeat protein [Accumulibacter sp.]HND81552.1 tetratricopeptide repeat protein [Accumulibacter sp.]